MTIVITLKVLLIIIAVFAINYACFAAMVYCDIRFLKSKTDDYDDMPFAVPYLFGLPIALLLIGAVVCGKIKRKLTNIPSIVQITKKHRDQDEDVTYQAEKYLLDKK